MIKIMLVIMLCITCLTFLIIFTFFIKDVFWKIRCGNIGDAIPYILLQMIVFLLFCISLCRIVSIVKGV